MIYILNGLKRYKKLVIVNSILSIVNMLVVIFLIVKYGLAGALIGTNVGPIFVFMFNLFAIGLSVLYLLRPFIVIIIFLNEFKPVEDLFLWQLLGDFVKVSSIVIGYRFLAKKMFCHYIITEALLVIILYVTCMFFIG